MGCRLGLRGWGGLLLAEWVRPDVTVIDNMAWNGFSTSGVASRCELTETFPHGSMGGTFMVNDVAVNEMMCKENVTQKRTWTLGTFHYFYSTWFLSSKCYADVNFICQVVRAVLSLNPSQAAHSLRPWTQAHGWRRCCIAV
ncbi:hypothetical protein GALMADRAFT_1249380 [Galerina marginata CBS 339.88]|uniref:Uncharacterized protein n=1 Tax=Galerina marginata (strain CBS 339.88) TaxID=685588 RepID=A0A067THI4_GALM3|nr:hypothetical protein GALMADRAFT_1249380 [Galerina marginata CBS 339.88]